MATSDRPSNQKSAINTISGNAKTTGGDQPFVGSFAAPVTDNGLGQLAQGFGQAAAGATQLAMAYKQREEETEIFNGQMAAINATTGLRKVQEEVKNNPAYQELAPDEIPSAFEKDFVALGKPQVEGFRAGLKTDKAKRQYDLTMAQQFGAAQQTVLAQGYQVALQKRVVDTLKTVDVATSGLQDMAATTGNTTAVALDGAKLLDAAKELTKKLPLPQQLQVLNGIYDKVSSIYVLAAMTRLRKDTTGDPAKVAAEIISETEQLARTIFPENVARQNSLTNQMQSIIEQVAAQKQRTVVEEIKYSLGVATGNFGSLIGGDVQVPKMSAQQLALLPKEEQDEYAAMLAMKPTYEKLKSSMGAGVPETVIAKQLISYERTIAELPPEQQVHARKWLSSWQSEVREKASPTKVAANTLAYGGSLEVAIQKATAANGGDPIQGGIDAIEANGGNIGASISVLEQTLQASAPNANGAAQAMQAAATFIQELSPINAKGLSKEAVTFMVLENKGGKPGALRVVSTMNFLGHTDTQTASKFVSAAYLGPNYLGSQKGMTQKDIADVRTAVATNPTIVSLRSRLSNAPQGVAMTKMLGRFEEALTAMAIANIGEGSTKKVEDALTNIKALSPMVEGALNIGSGGEKLVMVGGGGSTYGTAKLMAPETLSPMVKTSAFRKQFQKEIISPLLGFGDNPPSITATELETAPDKSGMLVTYINDYGTRVTFRKKDGTPLIITWKEAQRISEEGKRAEKALAQVSQSKLGATTLNQLGLSDKQTDKNRKEHNAAVLRARNKK